MIALIMSLLTAVVDLLASLLPESPFANITWPLDVLTGLSWMNWFFPVGECLNIMSLWLLAIIGFYVAAFITGTATSITGVLKTTVTGD